MANDVAGCTMIHGSKSQAASEPELEKKPDVWRLVGSWRSSGILKVKVKVWWEWKFVVSRKSSSKKGRKNYKFAKATLVLGARRQGQQKEGWEERTSFGLDRTRFQLDLGVGFIGGGRGQHVSRRPASIQCNLFVHLLLHFLLLKDFHRKWTKPFKSSPVYHFHILKKKGKKSTYIFKLR